MCNIMMCFVRVLILIGVSHNVILIRFTMARREGGGRRVASYICMYSLPFTSLTIWCDESNDGPIIYVYIDPPIWRNDLYTSHGSTHAHPHPQRVSTMKWPLVLAAPVHGVCVRGCDAW